VSDEIEKGRHRRPFSGTQLGKRFTNGETLPVDVFLFASVPAAISETAISLAVFTARSSDGV
jgi:hypothetical protein